MSERPLVSVIIPTKNSERTIETCLKSVREQTYQNVDIIVVDNFSGDKTKEIAQKYGKVHSKGPERSYQRNFGAKNAQGEYLFFIDSDMELTSKVVEECIRIAVYNEVHAIIVPEVSVGEGFWTRCKILERSCYIGDETIEAARFFKKDVFWAVGGYDEEIAGTEDWDLSQRVRKTGYQMERISALIKHREGKLSLRKTMLKKRNYGKTLRRYRTKHPEEAKQQLALIRPAFVKNWKELTKDPTHALGMLFMKTCEVAAMWVGSMASE